MPYVSQSDLEVSAGGPAKLVELADFDADGAVDAAVIARAISDASEWVDEALTVRYTTPITNPASSLVHLVADEAIYRIRKWRNMLTQLDVDDHKERTTALGDYVKGLRRPDNPQPNKPTRAGWVDRNNDAEDELVRGDFDL